MAERVARIKALGNHLAGRYIPFSEPKFNAEIATLDIADAYSLAAVAIDFLDAANGELPHVEPQKS